MAKKGEGSREEWVSWMECELEGGVLGDVSVIVTSGVPLPRRGAVVIELSQELWRCPLARIKRSEGFLCRLHR